jgi:hypothetical protein
VLVFVAIVNLMDIKNIEECPVHTITKTVTIVWHHLWEHFFILIKIYPLW